MQSLNTPVPPDSQANQSWLSRPLRFSLSPSILLLLAIMLLSAILHLWNIAAIGDSNTYYTAAVKSMLQSWHNFFFAAAEPGGSVTVDKPPLGLWVEAAFAWVLGVSGFSTSLPNILAGIFSIPVLYWTVKKQLGVQAGLLAALVLATTPVVLATDRNNTSDGLLTFTLLLAAWAFLKASETNRPGYLLLGALTVGLGFNIKMLQALLPLPAMYALYFLTGKAGWWQKTWQLLAASLVLVTVSLSWAVIVDNTPADQRPYIGSSQNNSVLELALGHNGLARLLGPAALNNTPQLQAGARGPDLPPGGQPGQQGGFPGGQPQARPLAGPVGTPEAEGGQGKTLFSEEVGNPGALRFFQAPLGKEMSWLLPLALVGLLLTVVQGRLSLPVQDELLRAFLLWGGWLLTCLAFFSIARFFHAYYLVLLAPALGGSLGLGLAAWIRLSILRQRLAVMILISSAGLSIAFQIYLSRTLGVWEWWLWLAVLLPGLGAGVSVIAMFHQRFSCQELRAGGLIILAGVMMIPLTWSYMTVSNPRQDINLPGAYSREQQSRVYQSAAGNQPRPYQAPPIQPAPAIPGAPVGRGPNMVDESLLAFLQENTQNMKYLLAVPNAHAGASYVLATGRPVLYMGGFSGSDPAVDTEALAKLVQTGELRYIFYNLQPTQQGSISAWLQSNCSLVEGLNQGAITQQPARGNLQAPFPQRAQNLVLYDCADSP